MNVKMMVPSFLAPFLKFPVIPLKLILRDKRLIIFFSHTGSFVDNSKYLFLETVRQNIMLGHDARIYWLTSNPSTARLLKSKGLPYLMVTSRSNALNALFYLLRARGFITSGGIDPLLGVTISFEYFLSLWHGVPLKRLMWHLEGRKFTIKRLMESFHRYLSPQYLLVTSRTFAKIFTSAFRIRNPDKHLIIDNYPRNDVLFREVWLEEINAAKMDETQYEKVVVYTPTFRDYGHIPPFSKRELRELDALMRRYDSVLVLKMHVNDSILYERTLRSMELRNIVIINPKSDVYPLLRGTHILITDYSSIYFDFILTSKPVIFYPFDLEAYRRTRGFYFNYNSITPGPKAMNFNELVEWIEHYMAGGKDYWEKHKQMVSKVAFDVVDGMSSVRLAKFVLGWLNEAN